MTSAPTPPESFINSCSLSLSHDENGNAYELTAECNIRDKATGNVHKLSKTVDLRPIVALIARQLTIHTPDIATGANFLSTVIASAKKVGSSKALAGLYAKVAPIAKLTPYGAIAVSAIEIAKKVNNARKGDPKALAEIKATAQLALQGDPAAKQAMQAASAISIAQTLKDAKNPQELADRLAQLESRIFPLLRTGQELTAGDLDIIDEIGSLTSRLKQAANIALNPIKQAKLLSKHRRAIFSPIEHAKMLAKAVRKAHAIPTKFAYNAAKSVLGPKPSGGMAETDPRAMEPGEEDYGDAEYGDEGDGAYPAEDAGYQEEDIAGWKEYLYSRPYRSPVKAILDGSPGISMALRSLYANGLDTILAARR